MTAPKVKLSTVKRKVLLFSRVNIKSIPISVTGVYAYWYRVTGKCIYIGKAVKQPIQKRLMHEWHNPPNKKLERWVRAFGEDLQFCYLEVKNSNISRMEERLIRKFHPETNTQHKTR